MESSEAWHLASERQNAKSEQVPGVVLPRKAKYGPYKTKYSGFLRTPGLNPRVIKNLRVLMQSPGPEKISGPGKGKPPGSYITPGSKRPHDPKYDLRGLKELPGSQTTPGSLFDLRVLNTTSGSEGTSGFSNDLRVLIRPQGPKYDLRGLKEPRVPKRPPRPYSTSGVQVRSQDLKENLRVPTRPPGSNTISRSKGETPDSHMTSGSKSDLWVQNDLRVHKTPLGYKRPPGQKRRGRARHNTLGPPGPKGLHPKTSEFEEGIHPTASGFQDESPSSLRVPGRSPSSLRILKKHARDPPGSKKARHKAILALIVAYLRGQTAILHTCEWPRINGRVQLAVPPSLFGMGTTAHHKQLVQEFYSGTKSELGYLQVPRRTC
ncbi:hypothetical protein DY000_02030971 [Brassica cretica]|uniref:Uncharacterized protein n=1 Tax=Brassica cretica TaxID=69181 RepID=A0ABQ7DXH9_BRACR|nr:hypothetical protein DY000_02030971 [Brassica cretica]